MFEGTNLMLCGLNPNHRSDSHGVANLHLHLLFGGPITVADDGDDAAKLHPGTATQYVTDNFLM